MTNTEATATHSDQEGSLMTHTVVITLTGANRDGQPVEYASAEQAQAAVDRFGHAVSVWEATEAGSVEWHVECASQRGDGGAFRFNNICAGLGLLSYVA